MYERRVVHAIQHNNEKEFHLRYRVYPSQIDRDRTFDLIDPSHSGICRVTLTVTAETVPEQTNLFQRNGTVP